MRNINWHRAGIDYVATDSERRIVGILISFPIYRATTTNKLLKPP